jgi:formamidopyrimidine-DNA glycosylase
MPSLPELEVYKANFTTEIIGRTVTAFEPLDYRVVRLDAKLLEPALVGQAFNSIGRYGKWLYLDFGAPEQLIFHLGLTGKFKLLGPDEKTPRYSCFSLTFDDGRRLVMSDQRHLGKIYLRQFEGLKAEKALGPDLFTIEESYFTDTLRRKRRGARDVLMDQKIIAGIGGKFADEILWQARLHPNTKLDGLEPAKLAELYAITMRVNREAIALDADVDRFPAEWLIPHRRTDRLCPHCGSELTERKMGGSAVFYCPQDQPAPNPYRKG